MKVFSDGDFLHNIQEKQFLGSPEWDSFSQAETRDSFQVKTNPIRGKRHSAVSAYRAAHPGNLLPVYIIHLSVTSQFGVSTKERPKTQDPISL